MKPECLKNACFAGFASSRITSENHYQPDILEEAIDDKNNDFATEVPKQSLETSHEVIISRNQRLVLHYYQRNKHLYPERFIYHLLLLFYTVKGLPNIFCYCFTHGKVCLSSLLTVCRLIQK